MKQTGYEWIYVLVAVCPTTGETVGLPSPYVDGRMMSLFLRHFSQQLPENVHAVLLWDQAGFHKCKELRIPENITIVELPTYSPELNPVENLWQFFRGHYWSNRSYENYDDLRWAACEAWQAVCLDAKLVKSIARCAYVERTN